MVRWRGRDERTHRAYIIEDTKRRPARICLPALIRRCDLPIEHHLRRERQAHRIETMVGKEADVLGDGVFV